MMKYHIVSIQDDCWQYLGSAKTHDKALGVAYGFIHEVVEESDTFTVKRGKDTANFMFEELTITVPENEYHSELEYPIVIFYEYEKNKGGKTNEKS